MGTSASTGGDANSVDISVTGNWGKVAVAGTGVDVAGDTTGGGGGGGGGGVERKSTVEATGSVTGATGGGGSVAARAGGGFAVTLSKCFLKWIFPNSTLGFGGEDSSAEPATSPKSILFLGLKSVGRGPAEEFCVSFCFSFPSPVRNLFGKVFLVKLKLKDTFCLPCSSRFTFVLVPLGKKRLEATPLNTGPLMKPAFCTVSGLPCKRRKKMQSEFIYLSFLPLVSRHTE